MDYTQGAAPSVPQAPDVQQIIDRATAQLSRMHNFRRQYDSKRSYFFKQYLGQKDQQLFPDNVTKRSNISSRYPFSNVETIVSRTLDAYFSFWPWFETRGRTSRDEPAAEPMQLVLDAKLRRAKFVKHFEDLIRNICIYGHAGIKVDWDWDYDIVTYPEPVIAQDEQGQPVLQPVQDPQTGAVGAQPVILGYHQATKKVPRSRPKFTAIDVYDLLVDPDGGLVAHMVERTFGQLKREAENYKASHPDKDLYYPEALAKLQAKLADEKDPDGVIIRMAELWNELDDTCILITFGKDAEAMSWKDLRYQNRNGANYSSYKRRVYAGEPCLLWAGPSDFAHKKVPILYTSYTKLPNEVYGLGAIEPISDLTDYFDRFLNMITDNWNLGINRRYAYDLSAEIDHESLNSMNVPGGKVGVVGDPTKVIMPLPFFTPQAGDYAILDIFKGMVESTSGISDFYSNAVGSPEGNRTATGIQTVIGEANYKFKMFIRNLELDILQPLLEMCCSMVQQFVKDEEEVQLTDAPPGIPKWHQVQPEELLGNLSFNLVAANYSTNKIVRQRNLMALVGMAGESPYWRQRPGLEEICKVMEIRNYNKLLKTDEEVAMEQAAAKQEHVQMMIFEALLQTQSKALVAQSRPTAGGGKGGRPAKAQFEGKIPGVGSLTDVIRDMAQGMGANSLGLEGLGHIPGS